jgi:hypothetical protein
MTSEGSGIFASRGDSGRASDRELVSCGCKCGRIGAPSVAGKQQAGDVRCGELNSVGESSHTDAARYDGETRKCDTQRCSIRSVLARSRSRSSPDRNRCDRNRFDKNRCESSAVRPRVRRRYARAAAMGIGQRVRPADALQSLQYRLRHQMGRALSWFFTPSASTRGNVSTTQKSCGQLLGDSWPRAIRSGTGRGGDVTGSRVLVV